MPPTQYPIPDPADRLRSGISAFDELADTIANPPAGRPLREAIGKSGQKYCDYYGALPLAAKNLLGPGFAASGLLCKPYWDKNGYDAPISVPPFVGGQCLVRYGLITKRADGDTVGNTLFVYGPVTGLTVVKTSTINERTTFSGFTAQRQPLTVTRNRGTLANESAGSATVYRTDGQPDTCGNVAGNPAPGPNPPPTPTFPPGEEPGTDPTGQPYFTVPPIDSPVPGEDPIDVPLDPGPAPDPPPPGADPGPPEAGPPGSTGEGGDDEGDVPEGKELWALKIDIDGLPARPNEYAPGVYRGVCYVYMGDENGLDHDPAGAMLRSGQLVLAEREGLTRYRVTANMGYSLTVTPYWREPRKES